MSKASDTFTKSIQDAENLLGIFDDLIPKPKPPLRKNEVLKRAGLVMAMTAWETYVEDRLVEACDDRLCDVRDQSIAEFVRNKLGEEIKRLHNPASQKSIELFRDYAAVDLSQCWHWNNCEFDVVKEKLDDYMKLRGDLVHRSPTVSDGTPAGDPVKKEELHKAINFLKSLVNATEKAFELA